MDGVRYSFPEEDDDKQLFRGLFDYFFFLYLNCHFVAIKDSDNNDRANLNFFF